MKKRLLFGLVILIILVVIFSGMMLFKDKQYAWISISVAVLACVPFFLQFEKRNNDIKKLVLIAVMVSLSVISRIIFTPLPGFKPVTALVVITAMYFGSEAGFMTGALSAVISNFYFGQGPWTPFQMLIWGLIGFFGGVFAKRLLESKFDLAMYGVLSGIVFSSAMDTWSVLWVDGSFNVSRFLTTVIASSQFMIIYAVSNVIFLLLFSKPIGKFLDRIKTKFQL
ncbi:MAG: ECF transporter S component [Eubacteriales bacterium]|nr:ECF transporter S component [Eubacteriales bacterium]MDD4475738.1 ECF transporter S component [Eubacteriales bacterium]